MAVSSSSSLVSCPPPGFEQFRGLWSQSDIWGSTPVDEKMSSLSVKQESSQSQESKVSLLQLQPVNGSLLINGDVYVKAKDAAKETSFGRFSTRGAKELTFGGTKAPKIPTASLGLPIKRSTVELWFKSWPGHENMATEAEAKLLSQQLEKAAKENGITYKPASPKKDKPKRIHVSNIPFRVKERDLLEAFERFGKVDEVQIISNEKGSKGFGFVTFKKGSDADYARIKMHRQIWNGRVIEVNEAHPRPTKSKAKNSGRGKEVMSP